MQNISDQIQAIHEGVVRNESNYVPASACCRKSWSMQRCLCWGLRGCRPFPA
jgi:hypothetical protein